MQLGGPYWKVKLGRRDSKTASMNAAVKTLPSVTSTVSLLIQRFKSKGLSATDMVAWSGFFFFFSCIHLHAHENTILLLNFGFGYYSICLVKLRELGASKRSQSSCKGSYCSSFRDMVRIFFKICVDWKNIYFIHIFFFWNIKVSEPSVCSLMTRIFPREIRQYCSNGIKEKVKIL